MILAALLGCVDPPADAGWDDVAPILARSCLPCHADGGAAGLPLVDPDAASLLAAQIVAEVDAGRMPPGSLDRTGACGDFVGPAPVDAIDRALLRAWLAAGAPPGLDAVRSPAPDALVADAVVELPISGRETHRCHLVEPGPDPGFLTALRVEATPVGALHHAMLFDLATPSDLARAHALDALDADAGWDCFGGPGVPDAPLLAVWTPGDPVLRMPNGAGVPMSGPMVVQLHTAATPAEARLGLAVAPAVDAPLAWVPVAAPDLALPPGEPEVTWTETVRLAAPDLVVHGVFPHLHTRGLALRLSAPDACLAHTEGWDYGWQEVAFYAAPRPLASGTPLTLSCTFSTEDAAGPTTWGEGVDDEMCMVFLLSSAK